ncbi:riboflavin synthase [Ruminiclostridium hungatei]|uniref:Riboflavin synthase n=1 Tax=Ruminiclostridium hungatei TaxID=48256 RepID=A0A1V4SNK5_RUMHU|nr:riboflavin synthase [Ruminiclostridium hungatei]OPX45478.1 riboflavin synthase [Ruminiclostridium hungatei]
MFTGIIEEVGEVRSIARGSMSIQLEIGCSRIMDDVKTGDSIAVNGICLTVTRMGTNWFAADVMPETMRRTGLWNLRTSDRVNLERAMRLSDRLGGHIVTGHIDGTAVLAKRVEEDNAVWLNFEASSDLLKYIVMKGSVALDGTSLTVAQVDHKSFRVSLIPLTAGITTLGLRKAGDIVNVECDIMGKYVEKLMEAGPSASRYGERQHGSALTINFLKENGYA